MRKLTRRSLAMAAVAIPVLAQQPSSPQPAPQQQAADADMDAARTLVRQRIEQLRKVKVPQLLEPATTFRA